MYLLTYISINQCQDILSLSVYILDEENVKWKHTSDLGDGIFMVFHGTMMFAISPKDLGRRKGNSVYISCYN